MPKARTTSMQHNADQMHYGAISMEMMPDATAPGDMLYWDGVQWNFIRLIGGGGLDVTYNAVEKTIEIYYADNRIYGSFVSDAIIFRTYPVEFYADGIILKTATGTFTADAALV